jgi:hypothetical protein
MVWWVSCLELHLTILTKQVCNFTYKFNKLVPFHVSLWESLDTFEGAIIRVYKHLINQNGCRSHVFNQ